ncbi:MAG TPA: acyltransferase [Spirochaetia bacterium]|nr:acyltransferase [Spirochaetia bacterium]
MNQTVKIALIQQSCSADRKENQAKSILKIKEASKNGAKLVVLQELHSSLYFCQSEDTKKFDLGETIPGPSTELFGKVAKEMGVVLVLSLFEKRAKGLYHNTAAVIENDGSLAGIYRKMHIPDDPGFYEKFYFTPGDIGFKPVQTSLGKLGVLVCWDQWYPEAARIMALKGAELLIYPTAIGWDPKDSMDEKKRQLEAWITIQRSHAIANGIPLLAVNRVGLESDDSGSEILFWGNSFAAGAQGEFLAQAAHQEETVLYADLNLERTEEVRRIWPFLRDRRIDFYQDVANRYLER